MFLYGMLGMVFLFIALYAWVYSSIPSRTTFRHIQNSTASEVYTADGKLIGKYFIQDRKNVKFSDISPNVINALIATEDVRFYEHNGVDRKGMVRVFFKTLLMGNESSGGGSTITQQLAKNLFPRKNYPAFSLPINKLREAITAQKLEDVFSKEEILELYLNTVPFGENAFGIEVASKRYFNVGAGDLKVEEAAILVGMLKATTTYNPRRHPDKSKSRRNIVLDQMAKYKYLTAEARDSLQGLPVKLRYNFIDHNKGLATYFREQLRQELETWCEENEKEDGTPYNLYTDGLRIYTTLDHKMQRYAETAVRKHMTGLQREFYAHWNGKKPWGKNESIVLDAMRRTARYRALKEAGHSEKEIRKIFNTPSKVKVLTVKGEKILNLSPMDSIRHYLQFLHPGFLVMEPSTGYIKAWVGGINHEYFQYDHVHKGARRQVGSTFKPIVYASALEEGLDPCEYIENERVVYEDYDNWSPGNADGVYGGKFSMEGALTHSVNTISAQLIMKAGVDRVVDLAERMGITSHLEPVPSLALGTADISLMEMVTAYGTFANNGYAVEPRLVLRIEDSKGNVIKNFAEPAEKKMVMSPMNAAIMTHMMKSVVDKGTAHRLRYEFGLTMDIAGKTGTTQEQADGWFIGFTPNLVAGAWVGGEDRRVHFRSLNLGQGAHMALPIWGHFMRQLANDKDYRYVRNASFGKLTAMAQKQMDCEPFIEADTLNIFQKLFGVPDSTAIQRRVEKQQEREDRRSKRREERVDFLDDPIKKFKDLFKKR